MKTFTKSTSLATAIMVLLMLASCKKENFFQPMDKQIRGNWKIEKVTFRSNNSFKTDDLTVDYLGNTLDLKDNHSLAYRIGSTGQVFSGNWELRSKYNYNYSCDQSSMEYLLDANVDQQESFLGTDVNVTTHQLTFYEKKNNGTYEYHFRR